MSKPAKYNYKNQWRGDTFQFLPFRVETQGDPNTAKDLTGAAIICQIRKNGPTGVLVKDLSLANGISIENFTTSRVKIEKFLLDFPAANYYYDIQVTFADASIITILHGIIPVVQDTSR